MSSNSRTSAARQEGMTAAPRGIMTQAYDEERALAALSTMLQGTDEVPGLSLGNAGMEFNKRPKVG